MTEITETMPVFVAMTNEDLTEARGPRVPLAVCQLLSTAIRLGKGKNVQGTDCEVVEATAYKIDGRWLIPGRLAHATDADKQAEAAAQHRRDQALARDAAIRRAEALGLSPEDIRALRRPA